ncbi:hypothetical protein HPB50_008130 [Hyalomma asiaticum]|uniref:Uncharacterized protein n=1 Tax=Hyalomma asiaticum TaxID=266040 RepID=A0ACB7TEX5_HYAAI|nr:hypothetical protein HPB50_008130 [Hyalomma asiaticum]
MSARLAVCVSLLVTAGGGAQSAVASEESEWSFVKGACVYRHLLFPNGANFTFRNPCEMVICDARNGVVYFKRSVELARDSFKAAKLHRAASLVRAFGRFISVLERSTMPWGCCTVRDVGPPPKVLFGDDLVVRSSNVDLKIDAVTGASMSYQELWEQTTAMASAFRQRGLTAGAKVCFHCSNHVLMWPAVLGITSIRGVLVMAKASLTVRELLYQLDDSRPMFVVTEQELAPKIEECKKSDVFLFGESADYTTLSELLEEGRAAGTDGDGGRPPRTDPRDTPMTVLYSSGTTGLPKGVVSSHFNFVSQIVQSGTDGEQILHYTDVLAQWMPCTHLSGVFFTLIALAEGATVVLLPGFRIELLLASIQRYQATFLPLLPTFAVIVTQSPLVERTNVSSVRTLGIGGSVTPDVVIRDLLRIFNLETLFHGAAAE